MIKLQERLREPIKLINDPPWYVRYLNGTQEGLLIREREEAADALDAAEAEIARLKEAVTDLGADVLRLHKEKCDLLCPETATQPPAVGEDE